jgi:diguanylate cyclase (GGDEF)-like protein
LSGVLQTASGWRAVSRAAGVDVLRRAFDALPVPAVLTDGDHNVVAANAAFRAFARQDLNALRGRPPAIRPVDREDGSGREPPGAAGPAATAQEVLVGAGDGSWQRAWMMIADVPPRGGHVGFRVLTFTPLAPIDHERMAWEHRAQHDPLTGLPNRRLLDLELQRSLARARRRGEGVAVMFVDVDGFKQVNDTAGHAAGDDLLRDIADRLRAAVRAGDVVARWGGDEFVVILESPGCRRQAAGLARSLLAAVRDLEPRARDPLATGVTHSTQLPGARPLGASVGVAMYPQDGREAEELLRVADGAMYRAKRAGGDALAFRDGRVEAGWGAAGGGRPAPLCLATANRQEPVAASRPAEGWIDD